MKRKASEQIETLHHVLSSGWVKDWRVAVDGGAHVGDWSRAMAVRFETVHAFEPAADTWAILAASVPANVVAHQKALWCVEATVEVVSPPGKPSTRSRYVRQSRTGTIQATTIDALGLTACGLIKLDVEGDEDRALEGAAKTIAAFKPVLIVEQDRHHGRSGSPDPWMRLKRWGYQLAYSSAPDLVYLPGT